MSCERYRALIIDALVGPLGPEDEAQLRAHLAACQACSAEARRYGELWRDLAVAAMPEPRPDALEALQARVREEREGTSGAAIRRATWRPWIQRAAAVVLLVGLGALLAWGYGALRERGEPAPAAGDRYLMILSRTTEPPEQSSQLRRELKAWATPLRANGVIESILGLPEGPAVGTPPDRSLMADDIAGLIVIRAASPAEARRIAASCPATRYGSSVEIRALD